MWLAAEEGLTDRDEGGEVEDGVWGQAMEIEPVVEHHPAHEWVQREPQASDEVGDKGYPLPCVGSGHLLVDAWSGGGYVGGEIPRVTQLLDGANRHDGTTPMPFEGIGHGWVGQFEFHEEGMCEIGFGCWSATKQQTGEMRV